MDRIKRVQNGQSEEGPKKTELREYKTDKKKGLPNE